MKTNANGTRFNTFRLYERRLHRPYDYANDGLIRHLMSRRVTQSKNPVLQYVLGYVERSLVYAMKYVDILQNFYNYNWKNR